MAFALTWIPAVLEEAGQKVAEQPGWQSRGRSEFGRLLGAMVHHTVGPRQGNMPSLGILTNGRSDLAGPLANLGLGRDGTWYVIAAGRANHAGEGLWRGERNGNSGFIGIEAENTGLSSDLPWPDIQMTSLVHGVAALLRHGGRSAEWCVGHKEYALPPGRKIDPLFEMAGLRQRVADVLSGATTPPPLIPAVEPVAPAGGPPRATIRRGSAGPLVMLMQEKLGLLPADGIFGPFTEAAVRAAQARLGLVPDGIIGPKSWPRFDTL